MRLVLALSLLVVSASSGAAFAPRAFGRSHLALESTVEDAVAAEVEVAGGEPVGEKPSAAVAVAASVNAGEYKARLESQLEKLKQKDSTSKALSKGDLKVVFEDEHIVVIDKPAGVLCVPGKEDNPSLNQAVFDAFGCEMGRMDKMVVHRLGMDTTGLVVFAKTMDAVRGMNSLFRTRKIQRQYEALLCGNLESDEGIISLPLMRDYEFPPYMRVSTDDHQRALIDLDPDIVGKKLLERPKPSLTEYKVVAREELEGQPVTRVILTSISGRTHQLNVHCAAFGHPIVGDSTYGPGGDAAPNGGLTDAELNELVPNPNRVTSGIAGKSPCVHAKSISFRHPVTKENVSFSSDAPF